MKAREPYQMGFCILLVRMNKHINRQPIKKMHSSNIVNNLDEKANLRNHFSELKELVHALVNKNDELHNSVFSNSKNAAFENNQTKTKV